MSLSLDAKQKEVLALGLLGDPAFGKEALYNLRGHENSLVR